MRAHAATTLTIAALALALPSQSAPNLADDFWHSRDVNIDDYKTNDGVRVGIWDSGVDLTLFDGRVALDKYGRPLVRGYNSFKRRQDTSLEVLPLELRRHHGELDLALLAFDDMDSKIDSPAAKGLSDRLDKMSKEERATFLENVDRWSGYAHGTAVADIALSGLPRAKIVVARMEWWHGSPPIPCWTRDLADREARSIRDLLTFLVESGARVVNMSWGRFEAAYIRNLEQCAPRMPEDDRKALARYSVETIRKALRSGMAAAPNVLFVGAAGNAGSSLEKANPATRFDLPNFLLVGAVDASGKLADYSNTGSEVSIYANGYRVPARLPGGQLSYPTGTSMATPNVTNVAAKMLAMNPRLTGAGLKRLIVETADSNATGQRLLHPRRAFDAARALVAVPAGRQ